MQMRTRRSNTLCVDMFIFSFVHLSFLGCLFLSVVGPIEYKQYKVEEISIHPSYVEKIVIRYDCTDPANLF